MFLEGVAVALLSGQLSSLRHRVLTEFKNLISSLISKQKRSLKGSWPNWLRNGIFHASTVAFKEQIFKGDVKKSLALPAAFRTLIVLFLPFQFSDMLLYTSKGVTGTNQFKIHGHLSLHGMLVSGSMLHHRVKEMALPKGGWGIPSRHKDQSHKVLQGWSQQQLVRQSFFYLQMMSLFLPH